MSISVRTLDRSDDEVLAPEYLTDAMGDLYAKTIDGRAEPVDPDVWGWPSDSSDYRCTLEQVQLLPGFTVSVKSDPAICRRPGPRLRRPPGSGLLDWRDGAAPPAIVVSKLGASSYCARLSGAVGWAASALPRNPGSSPFQVWDLLRGRHMVIDYVPIVAPGGVGCVYVVEDGLGVKIGHTTKDPALRIAALQTGNPRLLSTIAIIVHADVNVEAYLHKKLAKWKMQGEWFDRNHLVGLASRHRGWKELLLDLLPPADVEWEVTVLPPHG